MTFGHRTSCFRNFSANMSGPKQLMVSLVKSYPVAGLLIWKADKPPELKNVSKLPDNDEPGFLSYTIRPFCPTSADGLHIQRSLSTPATPMPISQLEPERLR